MNYEHSISKALKGALVLPLCDCSKYVIFSDCHRGCGKTNDNFTGNEFIFVAALKYYFNNNYTYIELGDGDELWENRSFESIKRAHPDSFNMLSCFYNCKRYYSVYGNHDMVKKHASYIRKHCHSFYCYDDMCKKNLFPDVHFYPSIVLENEDKSIKICMMHGHQTDFFNNNLWPVSRFLVRYFWRPLEFFGIPDPTNAAKNNTKKKKSEKHIVNYAKKYDCLFITGHTHNPMSAHAGSPYFNSGSCVSPYGITCVEIKNQSVSLVKWSLSTKKCQDVYIKRETLGSATDLTY